MCAGTPRRPEKQPFNLHACSILPARLPTPPHSLVTWLDQVASFVRGAWAAISCPRLSLLRLLGSISPPPPRIIIFSRYG